MIKSLFFYTIFMLLSGQTFPEIDGMIFIEGGSFKMGNPQEHHYFFKKEKPVHQVQLKSFYIGKYEVTNEAYVEFLNANIEHFTFDSVDRADDSSLGIKFERDIYADVKWEADSTLQLGIKILNDQGSITFQVIEGYENLPVTYVSWYGARAYCEWKFDGGNLPSESQWEYAARNGIFWDRLNFKYAGGNHLDSLGWYWENAGFKIHKVGQKAPNALGIHDLSGNLWEWVADHWHDNYENAPTDGTPWINHGLEKDYNRVLRGGAWLYSMNEATTTNRWSDVPDDRHDYKGFRCVCVK